MSDDDFKIYDQHIYDQQIYDQQVYDQQVLRADSLYDKQYSDAEIDERIIKERNIEIKQIANDMSELHDITNMISSMVYDQSEDIELAATNIENVSVNVEQATHNLELAEQHSVKSTYGSVYLSGTLVSTGLTGLGIGTMFINPIAGGVIGAIGFGGVIAFSTTYLVSYFK